MKPSSLSLIAIATFALHAGLSSTVLADTITLKNGTVLKGNIISDKTDPVIIEVKEKGISDEIKVKKADIASMVKETPEDKQAIEILGRLHPSKDNLTAADYDKAIKIDIQPWLDKNKTGSKRKEMEDLLKTYTEELAKVKAGDIKLRGVWIGVEEKKWNEYNINARKLRLKFEELIKERKYPEAYAVFAELEITGAAGVDFPPVVEQMKKVLPQLEAAINNAITEQPNLLKQRTTLLASMTPDQKKNEDLRIIDERKKWTIVSGEQRKKKYRIITWYPYDLKNIQDALAAVKKEAEYLGKLPVNDMIAANKRFEAGLRDLHTRAWLSAKAHFEAAAKVHGKDPFVKAKLEEATKAVNAPPPKGK